MYDIAFISYNEVEADYNWQQLKQKYPYAKRTHGIEGIHQAHIEAAKNACTRMFYIVDADAVILNNFDFSYVPPEYELDCVHVWRSQNPINNLVYGYGGVKLFPRNETINMDISKPDMTTSISPKFKLMQDVSNITAFNVNEFSTWRSAFRECAKLSSKIIDRQKEEETNERLRIWTTVGRDRPFGEYAIAGAIAGREFGLSSKSDLGLINNFDWLKEQFND
tara:strand:- start:5934 stop:6599 length:666 start_codon:yes stop_codon:yes gene_type:complete